MTATSWTAMGLSQKAVAAEAITQGTHAAPTIQELEQGIANRLQRVEEFRFIQEEATKLGVRAYLFGGTAAGYAHYVKWDLQREKGDKRFQKDRFDYDYTNIYRSTQDLDIVIDGNPEQAAKLQNALQEKYPHLQGGKTAWEVRLLTQDMGDKQAILNNPDFMNQHTDSNSTGMIEITKPKNGEHVVRDVRDWNSKEPYFLKDVHDGMLHYYFSPSHGTTKFAKEGRNPPIISAIRFLTKAFQYELKIRPEDLAQIRKVIQEFDPKRDTQNSYVAHWIEKNGKKLIQNAVSIEYAKSTLDQLELRNKLQSIKGNIDSTDSLAWWMNKEPLRTHPVGRGEGETARELGLDIVAHETNNFLAYESITRAHTGDPNVLISREGAPDEVAIYGDGFYTQDGKDGAVGSGLTIRFHLDPNAREGEDFEYLSRIRVVLIKNKAALRVIPESLNIGPAEYVEKLFNQGHGLEHSDRGILERLKRRIQTKMGALSDHEHQAVLKTIQTKLQSPNLELTDPWKEWFSFPIATKHPEIVEKFLRNPDTHRAVAQYVLSQPQWRNHPEWVERIIRGGKADQEIATYVLTDPHWKNHPELVAELINNARLNTDTSEKLLALPHWSGNPKLQEYLSEHKTLDKMIAQYITPDPRWTGHPQLPELLLKKTGNVDVRIFTRMLTHPDWKDQAKLVQHLIKSTNQHGEIAQYVLSQPQWSQHPELVEELIKAGTADKEIAKYVLTQPFWKDRVKWLKQILDKGDADQEIAIHVLGNPLWADHPEFVEQLFNKGTSDADIAQFILSKPHWKNHPEWVEKLFAKGKMDHMIARYVLSEPHWADHPEWVERVLAHNTEELNKTVAFAVLSKPHAVNHPEWMESLLKGDQSPVHWDVAQYALSQPHWKDHPEFIEELIKKGTVDRYLNATTLRLPHWRENPKLRRLTGGLDPTVENLRSVFARGETLRVGQKTCVLQHINDRLR